MRLIEFKITELFGQFDYHIPFNKNDQITIITGPNGYGKTAILNTVDAIFNGDFAFLFRLKFADIEISFSEVILVLKRISEEKLTIKLLSAKTKQHIKNRKDFTVEKNLEYGHSRLNRIDEFIPYLERMSPKEWFDRKSERTQSLEEVLDRYPELSKVIGHSSYKTEVWFDELIAKTKIHFTKDQRLLRNFNDSTKTMHRRQVTHRTDNTIELHAKELRDNLRRREHEFDNKTTEFDASLPTRLLKSDTNTPKLSIEALKTEIERLKAIYKRLNAFNILADIAPFDFDSNKIPEENRKFLSIYVNDHSDKLKIYEPIINQIELFTEILNNKSLAFKRVDINPEDGFTLTTNDNDKIELYQLSSGEQHLIVLIYELIFKAQKNDLVLIDEPEISLHIAWQKAFLSDIKRIIENKEVAVIVATHSPQIIDLHWDWTFDLED